MLVSESQSESVVSAEEGMDEEDKLSEVSDTGGGQFISEMLYTVDQINSFLDETKGPVDVTAEEILHNQESLALESEEDFSSSDQSGEDSEEERLYFEKRIDPKEDFCNR
ncbi:hypothetical protein MHYP_G00362700 [Metynnis hypsauchen]